MKEKFNINRFSPCNDGKEYYNSQPDFETAWNNCERGDWMLWMANKLNVDDRVLTIAKAHCANTVRHLMKDQRSIDAVDAAIKYGNGEISREELYKFAYAAAAAYAAADVMEASNSSAVDAYAAAYAAAAAAAAADDDDSAASESAAAAAYAAAIEENQFLTADICRKYLTEEVLNKIK